MSVNQEQENKKPEIKELITECVALRKKFNEHIFDIIQYVKSIEVKSEELDEEEAKDKVLEENLERLT